MIRESDASEALERFYDQPATKIRRAMTRLMSRQRPLTVAIFALEDALPPERLESAVTAFGDLLVIYDRLHPDGLREVTDDEIDEAVSRVVAEDERVLAAGGRRPFDPGPEPLLATLAADHVLPEDPGDIEAVTHAILALQTLRAAIACLAAAAEGPAPSRPTLVTAPPKPGRNDSCPCGSGRKYKSCCLGKEEQAKPGAPSLLHELDRSIVKRLMQFEDGMDDDLDDEEIFELPLTPEFEATLVAWCVPSGGLTIAEHYLATKGARLDDRERRWFAAQAASWLSIWEVTAVERRSSITLRDIISGETRTVHEILASQSVDVRDAVLGRVVDFEGSSVLCGMHPQPLPPADGAEVVKRWKKKFGSTRKAPLEKLRKYESLRALLLMWDEAEAEAMDRARELPLLQNNDGDPIILTRDRFTFDKGTRAAIVGKLAEIDGAFHEAERDRDHFSLQRAEADGTGTITAFMTVERDKLVVSTNSVQRGDEACATIEKVLGGLVRRGLRDQVDPRACDPGEAPLEPLATSPELQAIELEFLRTHYVTWPDIPLPALRGKTPRQAVKTKKGRDEVTLILKQIESTEQRKQTGAHYDVRELYESLGLQYE